MRIYDIMWRFLSREMSEGHFSSSELPTTTGDVIRVITGNGGGIEDLCKRDRARITADVKDGCHMAEHVPRS